MGSIRVYTYDEFYYYQSSRLVEGELTAAGERLYRVPYRATLVEPPEEEGFVAVYVPTTDDWCLLQDHRGEVWFDQGGAEKQVRRPGNPVDMGLRRDRYGTA